MGWILNPYSLETQFKGVNTSEDQTDVFGASVKESLKKSFQIRRLWRTCDLPRDKLVGGPLGSVLGVNHEEHVGETGAEIGSICVVMPGRLGRVDVHTFRAVQLHHGLSRDVRQA